jgi:pimeloyl-ACP methyl ester carboxylesterase
LESNEEVKKETDLQTLTHPTRRFVLPDKRRLGYAEYGDRQGQPVLLFHGAPGSRLFRHPDDSIAARLGLRLITVDRPGYGLSDYQPGREILDWPTDITFLANALGLDRFAVIGLSGGGPYAMACAYKMPHRLTGLLLVSSPGPLDDPQFKAGMKREQRMQFTLAKKAPWLLHLLMGSATRNIPADHHQVLGKVIENYPFDVPVVHQPGVLEMLLEDTREVFRQGSRGWIDDMKLLAGPWGFQTPAITVPAKLWHGDRDDTVPVATGHYLARTIPGCEATFFPGEGHLAGLNHWPEILAAGAAWAG